MITAKNEYNKRFVARDAEKDEGPFFCLSCGEMVILRKGAVYKHHFAHKVDSQCHRSKEGGESELHLEWKYKLYDEAIKLGYDVAIEVPCGPRISDVVINDKIILEVQLSPISSLDIVKRTEDTMALGKKTWWLSPFPHEIENNKRLQMSDMNWGILKSQDNLINLVGDKAQVINTSNYYPDDDHGKRLYAKNVFKYNISGLLKAIVGETLPTDTKYKHQVKPKKQLVEVKGGSQRSVMMAGERDLVWIESVVPLFPDAASTKSAIELPELTYIQSHMYEWLISECSIVKMRERCSEIKEADWKNSLDWAQKNSKGLGKDKLEALALVKYIKDSGYYNYSISNIIEKGWDGIKEPWDDLKEFW